MKNPKEIPAGYRVNASGHLVPEDQVRPSDLARDALALEVAEEARILSAGLKSSKTRWLKMIEALVAEAAAQFGVTLGGKKGNVEVRSYDGSIKVVRAVAERIGFSVEIEAAKALINDCIVRWAEGGNPHIRVLVDRAFRTDTKGQIRTSAVLELLQVQIDDVQWQNAMEAIRQAIQVNGTAIYVRVYQRVGESDQYEQIPLDMAAV